MPRQKKLRSGLLAALSVAMLSSGGLVAVGLGAGADDPPNLQPLLPTDSSLHVARFMDTVQEPGHTLVRFDTVLENVATSANARLDLYRTAAGRPTEQKIWQTDDILDTPSPNAAPADQSNSITLPDADEFFYFPKPGHFHFHFPDAADYQLTTPSGQVLADSPKNSVGFCLFDSYSQDGVFAKDPCHAGEPDYTGPIRMGISPGSGDLYFAGLTDQWVDVTNVMPGEYQIKAIANPDHVIRESTYADNVKLFPITVAGAAPAVAAPRTTGADTPVDIPLSATVYGADIPRRVAPAGSGCAGQEADLVNPTSACFDWTHASTTNVTFAVTGATGGTAAITSQAGLGATLRFTPASGFSGTATVQYTATDSRGLTSPPATATVTVTPPPGGGTAEGGGRTTTSTAGHPKPHFTLSARQLLINQRIGQAAIRRLNAVAAKLDGRPAPTARHKGGAVHLTAAQLLINQRIFQAAVRRAATLEARLDHTPAPHFGPGKGGTVHLTVGQLIINQRIAQAAVRRANTLVARVS
jgi:hypothetical protein